MNTNLSKPSDLQAFLHVLVIDDLRSSRTVMRHILSQPEFRCIVHEFDNGGEALRWCKSAQADLVVVDYTMPGMSGIEFIRQFRADDRNTAVPIMMVTVANENAVRQEALGAGVHDFILKPFHPRNVQSSCAKWLAMRRAQLLPERRALVRRNDESGTFKELGKRVMDAVAENPARLNESGLFKDLGRRVAEALRDMKGKD